MKSKQRFFIESLESRTLLAVTDNPLSDASVAVAGGESWETADTKTGEAVIQQQKASGQVLLALDEASSVSFERLAVNSEDASLLLSP